MEPDSIGKERKREGGREPDFTGEGRKMRRRRGARTYENRGEKNIKGIWSQTSGRRTENEKGRGSQPLWGKEVGEIRGSVKTSPVERRTRRERQREK